MNDEATWVLEKKRGLVKNDSGGFNFSDILDSFPDSEYMRCLDPAKTKNETFTEMFLNSKNDEVEKSTPIEQNKMDDGEK